MVDLKYIQKLAHSRELQALEFDRCKNDLYYWLTNWAKTLDSHDPDNPNKSFPDKDYIKFFIEKWLDCKLLFVPKSRQMMVSWICVACYLWDAQFHKGRLTFFQSKKADDANDLIKRAKTIWDNEPKFLKKYIEDGMMKDLILNPQNSGQAVYNLMTFPQIQSEIRGIPEGGDVIRMQTASGILSDECAFQPEASAAYTAAKPTISNKGRYTAVSTAEDNTFFADAVFDRLEM
jgi:hypothetical protein